MASHYKIFTRNYELIQELNDCTLTLKKINEDEIYFFNQLRELRFRKQQLEERYIQVSAEIKERLELLN